MFYKLLTVTGFIFFACVGVLVLFVIAVYLESKEHQRINEQEREERLLARRLGRPRPMNLVLRRSLDGRVTLQRRLN